MSAAIAALAAPTALVAMHFDESIAVPTDEAVERANELRALAAHLFGLHELERQTLARDLHDELGGTLSAIKIDLLMGRDAAANRGDKNSAVRLQRAIELIDSSIQFTRRLIENLRPTLLDNLGFEAALRSMAGDFGRRCDIKYAIELPSGELALTPTQSTTLYRVCQEALTNVMKYAKAKEVTISVSRDHAHWTLLLKDDGVGLDATRQHRAISHGLLGMRERVVALGGTFDVRGPAGGGTTLYATFPVMTDLTNQRPTEIS